jgi:hypothetical protein
VIALVSSGMLDQKRQLLTAAERISIQLRQKDEVERIPIRPPPVKTHMPESEDEKHSRDLAAFIQQEAPEEALAPHIKAIGKYL